MPSKKRKYNARFPAGRIKKIMQTDEEVGKVAQAVPIIICETRPMLGIGLGVGRATYNTCADSWYRPAKQRQQNCIRNRYVTSSLSPRTLELFVESLLSKAMQVTISRNAKTLSPSHVKQCILAESRFDFLKDLVKNIPDVSAAEEKEMMSAESSPNSSRYSDMSVPPRRIAREDSNSSSSSDIRLQQVCRDGIKRGLSSETERRETITSAALSDVAIDLSKRTEERPVRTANFYQETLITDELQPRSVITLNPTYATPQPSTSTSTYTYASLAPVEPLKKVVIPLPKPEHKFHPVCRSPPRTPLTPVTPVMPVTPVNPILNIDFSRNLDKPEIKVLDTAVAGRVGVPKNSKIQRQNSKTKEVKRPEPKPALVTPVDIDHLNSGNLQIDEDYDT